MTDSQYEDLVEIERGDESLEIAIGYDISGRFRPATWGWDGGTPPESPEIDIVYIQEAESGKYLHYDDVFSGDCPLVNLENWQESVLEKEGDKYEDHLLRRSS